MLQSHTCQRNAYRKRSSVGGTLRRRKKQFETSRSDWTHERRGGHDSDIELPSPFIKLHKVPPHILNRG